MALGAGAASAQSPDDILLYKGADREQKLIEGAKKEGQVVIYSAMIVNQAMRPIAEKFRKKYPFVKLTYWRADSEDIVQKALRRGARQQRRRRRVRGHRRRRAGGRGQYRRSPIYTPVIEAYPPDVPRPERTVDADAAQSYYSIAYNTRLVPRRQGAEELRGPARPAVEGQDGLAHRQRERHAAVHHQPAARLGRGEGARLFREAQGPEDRQFRRRLRAHAGRPRHRRRICDRAEHLRPPSADQQSQGRAGQFAAHGPGGRRRPPPWAS